MLAVFMTIAAEGQGQNSPQACGNLKDAVFSSPQTTPACHTTRLAFRSVGFTPPCCVTTGKLLNLSGHQNQGRGLVVGERIIVTETLV